LVREAKRRGLPVTAEVTPHHLTLSDEACAAFDTHAKCAPPLRTDEDIAAVREGLADGTIDAIATDHAPHSSVEKDVEFDQAAFGMIGFETAIPLTLDLVRAKLVTPLVWVQRLTLGPARALGLPGGTLAVGAPGDVTVVDPEFVWKVDAASFRSKSKNSPFLGHELRGRAALTVVGGKVAFSEGKLG
jgi:dihydroorotase